MKDLIQTSLLALFVAVSCCVTAAGGSNYIEAVDGDLSGNRLQPTPFNVGIGENLLSAGSQLGDLEYFRLTVPPGAQLTSIRQASYVSDNARAFLGMQLGSVFTVAPDEADPSELAGYVHFGIDTPNGNLLALMQSSVGTQGFTTPLPAGDYTFWGQQIEPAPTQYAFAFNVAAVPEPGTAGLTLSAILASFLPRRRR